MISARKGSQVPSSDDATPMLRVETPSKGTIVVSGELDMATAPQLVAIVDRLVADNVVDIVIELDRLAFCDSSGLSFFVQAHQTLRAAGGSLVLHNPSDRLRGLLATTSLDHELNIS